MFAKAPTDASTPIQKVKTADLYFCNPKCSLTYQFLAVVASQLTRWGSKIVQKGTIACSHTLKTKSAIIL